MRDLFKETKVKAKPQLGYHTLGPVKKLTSKKTSSIKELSISKPSHMVMGGSTSLWYSSKGGSNFYPSLTLGKVAMSKQCFSLP